MPFQTIEKTIPGLIPNERYVVRVRAISNLGVTSDWSEAYEVNIDDIPPGPSEFVQTDKVYRNYFAVASIAAGSTRTLSATFGVGQFSAVPYLSVSPFCTTTAAHISFHITQVSSTTASIVLSNNGGVAVDVGAYVMAIEI